ncbi:MAG: class I SAM-dependent DNA methyltransferase [Gammaproteobacteria bacterium]
MFSYEKHKQSNQANYKDKASDHDTLGLNSTLRLAYRDAGELLSRHLCKKNGPIEFLDFGCGVGLSTDIYATKVRQQGFDVNVTGVDVSEANLAIARNKLPNADLRLISPGDKLVGLGKFDLIICNFVLVEMESKDMSDVLSTLHTKLAEDGILIVTNTTARVYRPGNTWYSFKTDFPENIPTRTAEETTRLKYNEDQPVKIHVFASKNQDQGFSFSDYFHSGTSYRSAYASAGLKLLETHKPLGKSDDKVEWQSEQKEPPYKIHVLNKNRR